MRGFHHADLVAVRAFYHDAYIDVIPAENAASSKTIIVKRLLALGIAQYQLWTLHRPEKQFSVLLHFRMALDDVIPTLVL
jgi:hypothetical protein